MAICGFVFRVGQLSIKGIYHSKRGIIVIDDYNDIEDLMRDDKAGEGEK